MMQTPNGEAWMHHVAGRLLSESFVALPQASYQPAGFKFAVRRTRFEIAKFGMAETFFVFADLPALTPQSMAGFSYAAFQFAMRSKSVPLPCGLFESVWCFAVALTTNLHPQVAESIRTTTPPKHWSAGEIPVAFDAASGYLCYFEKTPMWGAAYYAGFRRQIQRYLA
jgi:hypothetical protein